MLDKGRTATVNCTTTHSPLTRYSLEPLYVHIMHGKKMFLQSYARVVNKLTTVVPLASWVQFGVDALDWRQIQCTLLACRSEICSINPLEGRSGEEYIKVMLEGKVRTTHWEEGWSTWRTLSKCNRLLERLGGTGGVNWAHEADGWESSGPRAKTWKSSLIGW